MKDEILLKKLEKQVRQLKIYALILTGVLVAWITYGFTAGSNHFKEITAERINIVERDGRVRMVLSNRELQHPGAMDGKQLADRGRPAGMIFFNDAGDECGGLVYDGDKKSASMTYSVDQWKNDQVMQMQYAQENENGKPVKSYGLRMWERNDDFTLTKLMNYIDSLKKLNNNAAYKAGLAKLRSEGLWPRQRLFAGRMENGDVGLFLSDSKGEPRLKIFIDSVDNPVIQSLDARGRVISTK